MKRPYHAGDAISVPLPDGGAVEGVVLALGSSSAIVAFDAFAVRVDDEPIVLYRWPVVRSMRPFDATAYPQPETLRLEASEIVQARLTAQRSGIAWERPQLVVRDVRSPFAANALQSVPGTARVQWRDALDADDLRAIAQWFERNPHATVRPYGIARDHAPSRALLRASVARERYLETADPARDADLARDAKLQTLVVRGRRDGAFDARELEAYPSLRALHVSGVELLAAEAIARLPNLRALRLRNVAGLRDLTWLEGTLLTHLGLDGILGVDDVGPVERMPRLRHLELRGAWQLSLDDVAWLRDAPNLAGLTLDIGGRRKNAEIFKARPRAYAYSFEAAAAGPTLAGQECAPVTAG